MSYGLFSNDVDERTEDERGEASRHRECTDTGVTCGEEGCPALADPAVYCELCGLVHAGACDAALAKALGVPVHVEEEKTEPVTMRCPTCGRVICGRVAAAPAPLCDSDERISA